MRMNANLIHDKPTNTIQLKGEILERLRRKLKESISAGDIGHAVLMMILFSNFYNLSM